METTNITSIKKETTLQRRIVDCAAIAILFSSGGVITSSRDMRGTMILFLLFAALCFSIRSKYKSNFAFNNNLKVFIPISFWPVFDSIVLHSGEGFGSFPPAVFGLGVLLILSTVDFYRFREVLLKWLNILIVVTLIAQLSVFIPLPTLNLHVEGTDTFKLVFGMINMLCGIERISSIYWEPGQFQIILFMVLCLFVDEWAETSKILKNLKKFFWVIIAIVYTVSTTAYLASIVFIGSVILFSSTVKKHFIFIPIAVAFSVVIGYAIFYSNSVQDKLEGAERVETSATIRLMDAQAAIDMMIDSPLTGQGMLTKEYLKKRDDYGNHSASNGWLNAGAYNGIPYLLFFLLCMYKNIRRQQKSIPALLILIVLIISQANEYFIFFPITMMYVYRFASYQMQIDTVTH